MIQPIDLPEDPIEFIKQSEPGTVIYGFSKEEGKFYIDFLVKEESSILAEIPERPQVEMRAGSLVEDGVFLSAVLFRFWPEGPVYETFWNYYREAEFPDGNIFEHMGCEPVLTFHFFGDSEEIENVVETPNSLHTFFKDAIKQATSMTPWTLQEFEMAKEVLVQDFETPDDLWEHLGTAQL